MSFFLAAQDIYKICIGKLKKQESKLNQLGIKYAVQWSGMHRL